MCSMTPKPQYDIVRFVRSTCRNLMGNKVWKDDPKAFGNALRKDITREGAVFVKLGQIMSTRSDILPGFISDELTGLQDDVEPFCTTEKELFRILDAEVASCGYLGHKDVFRSVSPMPIAAASIGQVHIGHMKNGAQVAIKIRRPNIQHDIDALETYMGVISQWVDAIPYEAAPGIHDTELLLRECVQGLKKEINFINEGKNIRVLQSVYKNSKQIVLPRVFSKLNTEAMLVMEYVPSAKYGDGCGSGSGGGVAGERLNQELVRAFVQGIIQHGVFHSDPHPGNIGVTPSGRIVLYDCGLVTHVPPAVRSRYRTALSSIANLDADSLVRFLIETQLVRLRRDPSINRVEQLDEDEYVFLYESMEYLLSYLAASNGMSAVQNDIANDPYIMSIATNNPFYIDSVGMLITRTFLSLEGTCKRVDPSFSYTDVLSTLASEFAIDTSVLVEQFQSYSSMLQPQKLVSTMQTTNNKTRLYSARIKKMSRDITSMQQGILLLQLCIGGVLVAFVTWL